MEITIRRAIPSDALFLTSISFSARRYLNDSEEYLGACHNELTITEEYIEKNIVFVAQKKATIIGYCSMVYRGADEYKGETKIKKGYWLDHIFIRPAYIRNGIGSQLLEELVAYCEEQQIQVLHILSDPNVNGFYDKIGTRYNCVLELEEQKDKHIQLKQEALEEKLYELDKDADEDEEIPSIENFKFTAPIGYKFQCEEELQQLEENQEAEELEIEEEKGEQIQDLEKSQGFYEIEESEGLGQTESLNVAEAEEAYSIDNNTVEKISRDYIDEKYLYDELQQMLDRASEDKTEEVQAQDQTSSYIKSEKEKMLQGEQYIAWGNEIVEDRRRARKLLKEFNLTDPEDKKRATHLLKELLGEMGEYVHIEPDFKCNYGYNIHIGDNFYAGYNCVILDNARVSIGDNCVISPQVGIYTLAYPTNAQRRLAGYEYAKPIVIGNNVWIGGGAIINPGVTIGNDVVISPGSVITSDIPNHVVVGGNPAKIIKEIDEK